MSLSTFTLVIDRDELLGPGNDLDVNASPFKVVAEGLRPGGVAYRRETVESPYVDGGIVSHYVKAFSEGQVGVYVSGTTQADLRTNLTTLLDAFNQSTYTLTATLDGAQYRWRCYAADSQVGWRAENFHGNYVVVAFTFPRQPTPLLGPI